MSLNKYLSIMSKEELEIASFEYQEKLDLYNHCLKHETDCFLIQELREVIVHYASQIEKIQIKLKERF